MLITNVHATEWEGYLERLMAELPTIWVTIEIEAPGLGHQIEARDLLLEDLGYDRRNDVVEVAAFHPGPKSRAVLRHLIDHPERISVDSPAGILPTAMLIENREGVSTLVRLHRAAAIGS